MIRVQPQGDRLLDVAYQQQQTNQCQEENTPHQQGYTHLHEYYQPQGKSQTTESINSQEMNTDGTLERRDTLPKKGIHVV
jgi:hypothetical protein